MKLIESHLSVWIDHNGIGISIIFDNPSIILYLLVIQLVVYM